MNFIGENTECCDSEEVGGLINDASPSLETTYSSTKIETLTGGGGGGEANTSSSAGGASLVLPKVGVDLPFKGLTAGSTKLTLTSNPTSIGIDVDETKLDHANLIGVAGTTNTHAQIDTHIADATLHFTEASIDHANLVGVVGTTNTHAQIDTHIADATLHFTEASINHANLVGVVGTTNTHAQIDQKLDEIGTYQGGQNQIVALKVRNADNITTITDTTIGARALDLATITQANQSLDTTDSVSFNQINYSSLNPPVASFANPSASLGLLRQGIDPLPANSLWIIDFNGGAGEEYSLHQATNPANTPAFQPVIETTTGKYTVSAGNSGVTITDAGTYRIMCNINACWGNANEIEYYFKINGVEQPGKLRLDSVGGICFETTLALVSPSITAGSSLQVWAKKLQAQNNSFIIHSLTIHLERLGPQDSRDYVGTTVVSNPPANTHRLYVDSGDSNKLKIRDSAGAITEVGIPPLVDHTLLTNIGTKTHDEIDTHINDLTLHRVINNTATNDDELWSAFKISTELATKSDTSHAHDASVITYDNTISGLTATNVKSALDEIDGVVDGLVSTGGEPNTASSAGGTSLVLPKVGLDLPFKGLTAGSTKLTLTSNLNDIGIDVDESKIDHANLIGVAGTTNTHAQIDTHIADVNLHRVINNTAANNDELWSAQKISTELATKSDTSHAHDASVITYDNTISGLTATNVKSAIDEIDGVVDGLVASGGEANTSSSAGGTSLVLPKVGVDLPFKGLTAGSTKLTLTSNLNDIGIDVNNTEIKHADLIGVQGTIYDHANIDQHLDDADIHRTINNAGTSDTDLWSAQKISTELATKSDTSHAHDASVITYDNTISGLTATNVKSAIDEIDGVLDGLVASGGEANTSSSAGGTSLVLPKVGVDLPFKGLTAGSTKLTLTSNLNDIGLDVDETKINHANLVGVAGTFYNHAQIDTHINNDVFHRTINNAGTSDTDLWSAQKISTELATKANTSHTHTWTDVTDFELGVANFVDPTAINNHLADSSIHYAQTSINHANLIGVAGTIYNHSQIDTHIDNAGIHFTIDNTTPSATTVYSSSKVEEKIAEITVWNSPAMTSANTPSGFVITTNSENGSWPSWKGMDRSNPLEFNTNWYHSIAGAFTAGGVYVPDHPGSTDNGKTGIADQGVWLVMELDSAKPIDEYTLYGRFNAPEGTPQSWHIIHSLDGVNYTSADQVVSSGWGAAQSTTRPLNIPSCKYIGIQVYETNEQFCLFEDIQFKGTLNLIDEISLKANTNHTHTWTDVTDFGTGVSNFVDTTAINNHLADSSIHFTVASIDHGSITGLGDDDHPQYLHLNKVGQFVIAPITVEDITIQGPLTMTSTEDGLKLPSLTTAQRTALPNTQGLVVYDNQLSTISMNDGANWSNVAVVSESVPVIGPEAQINLIGQTATASSTGAGNDWLINTNSQIARVNDGVKTSFVGTTYNGLGTNATTFDVSTGSYLLSTQTTTNLGVRTGVWVQIPLGASLNGINKFRLYTRSDNGLANLEGPDSYYWLLGTSSNGPWTEVAAITGKVYPSWVSDNTPMFVEDTITATDTAYTHVRLVITVNGKAGFNRTATRVCEIEVFHTPITQTGGGSTKPWFKYQVSNNIPDITIPDDTPTNMLPVSANNIDTGSNLFTINTTNGRITYTGTETGVFSISISFSYEMGATAGDTVGGQWHRSFVTKNGVSLAGSTPQQLSGGIHTGLLIDEILVSMNFIVDLSQNDYLTYLMTQDGTSNPAVLRLTTFNANGFQI